MLGHLEASGAPVHEGHVLLEFGLGDGGVDILGHHVAAVEQTAGHVLALARVTFNLHTHTDEGRDKNGR